MTTLTIRLSKEDHQLIKDYAAEERRTMSDVVRLAILDQIEDRYDFEVYKQAKAEFKKDPVSYSLSEIKEMHGLQ